MPVSSCFIMTVCITTISIEAIKMIGNAYIDHIGGYHREEWNDTADSTVREISFEGIADLRQNVV